MDGNIVGAIGTAIVLVGAIVGLIVDFGAAIIERWQLRHY
jgi:Putative Flp pilus-assembly TadE/G-like